MHLTNYAVNKTSAKFRGAASGGYNPDEDQADVSAGGKWRRQHKKVAEKYDPVPAHGMVDRRTV